jgi:hypothetical protein
MDGIRMDNNWPTFRRKVQETPHYLPFGVDIDVTRRVHRDVAKLR